MSKNLDDIHNVLVDIKEALVRLINMKIEKERAMAESMQLTDPSEQTYQPEE